MIGHALITGGAGFIGSHLVDALLEEGWQTTVVDNFDPYYDPEIKRRNLAPQTGRTGLTVVECDIRSDQELRTMLRGQYDVIVHLAARAGVRPSIADPILYQQVNVQGTQNLLEFARDRGVRQFVFASSSSVYGTNPNVPWREEDHVLRPISPYAATKVTGELLGHVYASLYGIRFIALRFFTVYGPRQRPDLAIHKFARLMLDGESIPVYGDGKTRRDYTYIDNIVSGVKAAMSYGKSNYEVINLGNSQTVTLLELIDTLESVLDATARIRWLPEQPGDVPQTWADIRKAEQLLGYTARFDFRQGLSRFAEWFAAEGQRVTCAESK